MALDEQELQEQLFEDIGTILDVLNKHSEGFVALSDQVRTVYEAVSKPADGDGLYEVLRDIHAAIERNSALLTRVEARLARMD
jgi:hypothetical protein